MREILILEDDDAVDATDWCRPLAYEYGGVLGDQVMFISTYSGKKINNMKWYPVSYAFGEHWYGKTVAEINEGQVKYAFARGTFPPGHTVQDPRG